MGQDFGAAWLGSVGAGSSCGGRQHASHGVSRAAPGGPPGVGGPRASSSLPRLASWCWLKGGGFSSFPPGPLPGPLEHPHAVGGSPHVQSMRVSQAEAIPVPLVPSCLAALSLAYIEGEGSYTPLFKERGGQRIFGYLKITTASSAQSCREALKIKQFNYAPATPTLD